MSRRVQENIIAVAVLAIFIAAIIASMNYGPRARLVPIPIASLGAILTVAQLIYQNFRPDAELQVNLLRFLAKGGAPGSGDEPAGAQADGRNAAAAEAAAFGLKDLAALGVVALLVALMLLVGPYAAVFAFTAGYFVASKQYPVIKALVYALGFAALAYLVFHVVLDVQFELSPIGFGWF
ncbi:MAG TPA: tripartite tricarboxylate transporter TctB family protein [Pseudolabrys sp.]|nr:tripartite tricarboxylate transporter TctB family protein [Pseudolabrys sp.]